MGYLFRQARSFRHPGDEIDVEHSEPRQDAESADYPQPDHDGETSDGKKVQIKSTFKDSLTFRTVPDYYLGFKLFRDGHYEEIFNGPGRIIYENYQHRKGIGEILLSFPINELKRLSESVPDSERIKLRNV